MPDLPVLPCNFSLIPPDTRVLVAVSGGADSLALLMMLHEGGIPLVAAHINHGLRGIESDEDEQFVLKTCKTLKVEAQAQRVQIKGHSENAARQARYVALQAMAASHGCTSIATGHTADDVLETVLLNWLRGASIAGLAGIPMRRELEGQLFLVRPLLEATREETHAFCRARNWQWREDSSNNSNLYTRNRVRALLPQIAQAGRVTHSQLARQTARAALLWGEENEWLDALAGEKLELFTLQQAPDLLVINGLRFIELPAPLARRLLRLAAQKLNPDAREIGSQAIERVRLHIAASGRHAVWQWPCGIDIEWSGPGSGNRIRVRFVRQKTSTEIAVIE